MFARPSTRIRTRGYGSHRLELEALLIRGIHRFRHAPVLELGVTADVSQVRNLPSAIDVGAVNPERLLRLLRIRFFGEQIVLERVLDRVRGETFHGGGEHGDLDQKQRVRAVVPRDRLHFGDARVELARGVVQRLGALRKRTLEAWY